MKKGRPTLVGPGCPVEVLRVQAEEKGAVFHEMCDGTLRGYKREEFLEKDYDLQNSDLAAAAIALLRRTPSFSALETRTGKTVTPEAVKTGTARRPPCRFEPRVAVTAGGETVDVVLDVAHNPDAMTSLFKKLAVAHPGRRVKIVVGMSADKDIGKAAETILERVDPGDVYLCEAQHPRAASLEQILAAAPAFSGANFPAAAGPGIDTVHDQTKKCVEVAGRDGSLVVVCGSVFIMSSARLALGYLEPRDSDYIAKEAGAGTGLGNTGRDMQEHFGNREGSDEDEESSGEGERGTEAV